MPRARLELQSNAGLVALSEAHPDATFAVVGAWPTDGRLRALVETADLDAASLEATVGTCPHVENVVVRSEEAGRVRFEVDTPEPPTHGAMAESGVVPPFPLSLQNGWLSGELVTTRSQLATFRAELEAGDIPYELRRIETADDGTASLLTARQREVVDSALSAGYYDYPRRCTATELAAALEVDKSVVSRILQRAESRVMHAQFG